MTNHEMTAAEVAEIRRHADEVPAQAVIDLRNSHDAQARRIGELAAERDGAYAKSKAILREMDDQMDHGNFITLKVDILGMAFYRQTGIWPTFKSAPMGMYHELSEAERRKAYSNWYYSATGNVDEPVIPPATAKETFTW